MIPFSASKSKEGAAIRARLKVGEGLVPDLLPSAIGAKNPPKGQGVGVVGKPSGSGDLKSGMHYMLVSRLNHPRSNTQAQFDCPSELTEILPRRGAELAEKKNSSSESLGLCEKLMRI